MDPIIYKKTHKRIRELNEFTAAQGDPIASLVCSSEAANWSAVIDGIDDTADMDDSFRLPLNRLLLLSPNRKIPAALLPSFLSYQDRVVTKQYVSGSNDPREALPAPGDSDYGNMDVVYKVTGIPGNEPDALYRFALTDSLSYQYWYEAYHSLSSNLKFKNGDGTLVSDNINPSTGMYSRQIDVNIGDPQPHTANILELYDESSIVKLAHSLSSNVTRERTSPDTTWPSSADDVDFGSRFYIPYMTVDSVSTSASTGHVENLIAVDMRFPSTAATTELSTEQPGLVKIGTDIRPIGSQIQAGTTSTGSAQPYIGVAAADHVHTMSSIEFEHANVPALPIIYNGVDPLEYDFNNILKATLPAAASSSDYLILVSQGISNQWRTTAWKSADYAFPTDTQKPTSEPSARAPMDGSSNYVDIQTIPSLTAEQLYLVTAQINVMLVNGSGNLPAGPVPTMLELWLKLGNVGAVKKVNIPGTWTYSGYNLPWTGTVSWIVKLAPGQISLTLQGAMPATSSSYQNIFGVQCTSLMATRLR